MNESGDTVNIALIGNPNCGKTTLFNALTGSRQKTGNWPGVTVEKKQGQCYLENKAVNVVDLPGIYSLDGMAEKTSLDERIARDFMLSEASDFIVNIVDASNLERNLYLTLQLLETRRPMMVVVNMLDVAKDKQCEVDLKKLQERLQCPVVGIVASRKAGLAQLQKILCATVGKLQNRCPLHYQPVIERGIASAIEIVRPNAETLSLDARWWAIKLLEGYDYFKTQLSAEQCQALATLQQDMLEQCEHELDLVLIDQRYQHISEITQHCVQQTHVASRSLTERIDRVVLNRFLGIPIFLGIMYLMFMFTINIGSAFIDFFDGVFKTIFVDGARYVLQGVHAPAWLTTFLADGVGGGIELVASFVPVIGCLFLFMSVLEDSGYIARAAFVMDRLMRAVGLPGKAFVSMLVGFGCNVPSVMATRTLENQRDRYLTIAMVPFMSCGARLSVYALFAVGFFGSNGQNVVFALYVAGIFAAIVTGLVLRRTLLPSQLTPFVIELPTYHIPVWRGVLRHTWGRLKGFVLRAGKAIILVVVVLNILSSLGTDGSFNNQNTDKSVLTHIGQAITPVFAPMGLTQANWPATLGIFTGIFAKEVVVGTLNTMYAQVGHYTVDDSAQHFDLWAGMKEALLTIPSNLSGLAGKLADPLGLNIGQVDDSHEAAHAQGVNRAIYSTMASLFVSHAAAFAYMLFILLYTPCVAALGAIYRETTARWTVFVASWTLALAYMSAVAVYQVSRLAVAPFSAAIWLVSMLLAFAFMVFAMHRYGVRKDRCQHLTHKPLAHSGAQS